MTNAWDQLVWNSVYDGCYEFGVNDFKSKRAADKTLGIYKRNEFKGTVPELISEQIELAINEHCESMANDPEMGYESRKSADCVAWKPNLWVAGEPKTVGIFSKKKLGLKPYTLHMCVGTSSDLPKPMSKFDSCVRVTRKIIEGVMRCQ